MVYNVGIQKHELKPTGKILDVASGQFPFLRKGLNITHIDKYPDKNVSRRDDFVKVDNFIEMDVEDMSFKDKEFDYVIAGDILEHLEHPERACREIMRVGKAGWVRCPTVLWESVFGREYHLWATNIIDETLVFYRKDKYFKCWDYTPEFKGAFMPETLHVTFEWTKHFEYKILQRIL